MKFKKEGKTGMSLIFDHVSFKYNTGKKNEPMVLDDISFQVETGDFLGIIGHTGSGKSTLVQHMNGLLLPTKGNIYFNGQDITDSDYDRVKLRQNIGLVFQYPEYQLFENSVIEDVKFGPKNMGLSQMEVDLRAYEALKLVGIGEDLLDASPFMLSGGQKRRAAIAGVLAMKPQVLVMDEPTAGLDPAGKEELYRLIRNLHEKQNMTVIIVSHSMEEMGQYAQKLLVLNKGKILAEGTPKEVFCFEKELEMAGLKIPEVTYIMNRLREKGWDLKNSAVTVKEAAELIFKAWKEQKND